MKEVRAYILGLVDGVFIGVGGVGVVTAWLVARGKINLKMLDPKYVRDNYIYQPRAPWIRNHFDYSYHGRHYSPYRRHYDPFVDSRPEEPIGTVSSVEEDGDGLKIRARGINPDCSDCRYATRSAEDDPCNHCKRAFDGYPNDYYYKDPRECSPKCAHFDKDIDFVHYCTYCKQNSEVKDGEDFYEEEEDHFSLCYKCKYFEDEADRSPCVDCKHNTDDGSGPDCFEYNPDWEDDIE